MDKHEEKALEVHKVWTSDDTFSGKKLVDHIATALRDTERNAKRAVLDDIRWAYETLQEINPSNYDHDDVCNLNAASVEVLLRLGNILNENGIDLEEVEG